MVEANRTDEPVLLLCQDNDRKLLFIHEMNGPAQAALGALTGKPLAECVPERIARQLADYVEYEADGKDAGEVLGKVQNFALLDSSGKEQGFRLKVLRSESLDKHGYFRLMLQEHAARKQEDAFRKALRENFKGHEVLDAATNLPDRGSLVKDIEIVLYYIHKEALLASFALLEIDGFDEFLSAYGREVCNAMRRHVAQLARQNLRPDDVVGSAGDKRLGIVLLDTNSESARMVLNRLRWLIAANPFALKGKKEQALSASIGFARLGQHAYDKEMLTRLEGFMDAPGAEGNRLSEMVD